MSRYMINKLMLLGDSTDAALEAFKADTTAFIAGWEASGEGSLTPEERAAFEEWDYATLYAMGGHPYILWQFIRAIYVPERMTVHELSEAFVRAVTVHGYADYAT